MLKSILLGLTALLVVFLVVAAFQPSDFRVTRSAVIAAPPAAVFAQINDLQKWNAWSPWAKLDPNAKNTFEGPTAGAGAVFAWSGNSEVGEGRMTITESRPNERVVMRLDFVKPFAGTANTEFSLKADGAGTAATWTMSGKNNYVAKVMGLVMNCDKMIGGQFEQGFANLKALVERAPNS